MLIAGRVAVLVSLLVYVAVFFFRIHLSRQGHVPQIRRLAGIDAIEEAVGRATETGRPVHHTVGPASVMSNQAPITLAGLASMRFVAGLTAKYNTKLITTVCKPETYPIVIDMVRQSYVTAGRPDAFDQDAMVRFLSPDQFAFTSMAVGIMHREQVAANVMIGYFMAESLILAETGHAVGAIQIAGTNVQPQIPFFVVACDYSMIGEEVYTIPAYLDRDPVALGSIAGQDMVKLVIVMLMFVGSLAATMGSKFLVQILNK